MSFSKIVHLITPRIVTMGSPQVARRSLLTLSFWRSLLKLSIIPCPCRAPMGSRASRSSHFPSFYRDGPVSSRHYFIRLFIVSSSFMTFPGFSSLSFHLHEKRTKKDLKRKKRTKKKRFLFPSVIAFFFFFISHYNPLILPLFPFGL